MQSLRHRSLAVVPAAAVTAMVWAGVAQAATTMPPPHEAIEAGRWSLLIAAGGLLVGLPLALFALGLLFAGINRLPSLFGRGQGSGSTVQQVPPIAIASLLRGAVIGADKRVSTSKSIAVVWTYSVAAGLLSIVVARWLGHDEAYKAQLNVGLQAQYALLIGGPLGAAILAKGIVSSQVANDQASKPAADSTQVLDLVQNDQGETDLGDLQYVLFNAVALVFFFGELIRMPQSGLPTIPDVLLGLTSVAAVGYVGKKTLTSSAPTITKIDPKSATAGQTIKIFGSGLLGDKGQLPKVSFQNASGQVDAAQVQPGTTTEGTVLDVQMGPIAVGTYDVVVVVDGKKATAKGALTIT